jgi:UDP-2,3-diacylglucosamine hydrolase
MPAIFLSDVHLKDATSVKAQLMIRFFQQVTSRFEDIYILGDLFDVWPGTTDYLAKQFRPILQVLGNLVRDGHRVHYLEGNHDFRLGKLFTDELGIRVYPDEIVETWNGRRIYMAHGDLGNPAEKGYRVLRYLLRQDLLHQVVGKIPQEWVFKVGDKASRLSRAFQKKVPPNEAKIREIYRQTANRIFQDGYDVVIMGHTHYPDHYTAQVSGRQCHYFNTGDWVKNFTYLEFDGSEFYTKTHPVKNL